MSHNSRVVEFFITEFYKNNSVGMVSLISPSFSFTQNLGAKQTFKQFIERMRFLNHSAEFEIFEAVSSNDTVFYSQFEVRIPSGDSDFVSGLGRVKLVVEDRLLCSIDISYHKTQKEYEEFQSLMKESPVAFV